MAFSPVSDISLPNGGEIHANSYLSEDGRHAVVLHLKLPHSDEQRITLTHLYADVQLPPGYHICFDPARAFPATAISGAYTRQVQPNEMLEAGTLAYCSHLDMVGVVEGGIRAPQGWISVRFHQLNSVVVLSPRSLFVAE